MLTQILFLLFVLSGFCGLLYQVVWLRLAFGAFGIVTPVLSVVVSVFMLGLALGSWGAGRGVSSWARTTGLSPIYLYASAEAVIGLSAFLVPLLFDAGQQWLLRAGQINSLRYLVYSGAILSLAMLPPCVAMGATFPLMLAFIKSVQKSESNRFSFLYLANVFGASLGAAATPVILVEQFGFRGTLVFAALINFLIGIVSVWIGRRYPAWSGVSAPQPIEASPRVDTSGHSSLADARTLMLSILFITGFSSIGLEVIWTRAFTTVLGTYVYSFAGLLFAYLWATWIGSWLYRRHLASRRVVDTARLIAIVAVTSLLPIVVNDARISFHRMIVALVSIFPFCAALGYLTPALIDRYSGDDPGRAGKAYAVNVIGCVLGPLVAGYLLLPAIGARFGMVVLAAPFLALIAVLWRTDSPRRASRVVTATATVSLFLVSTLVSASYEDGPPGIPAEVRRDHTATVVSYGEDLDKRLLVNGIGITSQTPVTKLMAHIPLGVHGHANSMAVICFGMGTTYRSALTWGVSTTAVDLARSVPEAFPYYFDDALALINHPKGRIVIDDGRRFLHRTADRFDVITIDPPPPLEAAGSSLLYSKEFYELVKTRLRPGGTLQQWNPTGEALIESAIARSLADSFDHVVAFRSFDGMGTHYTASQAPIAIPSAEEFVSRLPESARRDLVEWNTGDFRNVHVFVARVLNRKIPIQSLLNPDPGVVITDDRPFNEYYLLRRAIRRVVRTFS
jgi:spermidine synthase